MSYVIRGTKDNGRTRYDSSADTLAEAHAKAADMTAAGYSVRIEIPGQGTYTKVDALKQQLIDAAARAHNVPPPPSDELKPSNVVPFRKREKVAVDGGDSSPTRSYVPKDAADIFNKAMERNKENRERLAKERAKSNKAVTRSYDLTPKGGK
jgi:hypothetical protein